MITIKKGSLTLDYKRWVFPDQSIGVRLDTTNLRYRDATEIVSYGAVQRHWPASHQTIWARLQSSADIMELVMVTDALRRWDSTPIRLVMPCVPYQRQDRVGVAGESHSLKAFAALINGLGFEKVTVMDPHSDVVGAVLDRVEIIDQATIIGRFDAFNARLLEDGPLGAIPTFVSPDAGANKKVAALAALYGHSTFIRGDKKRDLATGKLTGFKVYAEPREIEGRDVIICDDLLDGGGTFVGLAAELKAAGARRIELYVTHAIASKGLAPLLNGGIDHIWMSDSYRTDLVQAFGPHASEEVPADCIHFTVLKLEKAFYNL